MEQYVRKVYRWTEGTSAHLNVGIRWRCVVSFMLWLLYPQYLLDRRLSMPHRQHGYTGKGKILVPIYNQTQGVANWPAHFNVC